MKTFAESHDFLFAFWDGGGHLSPVISAARRLVARGHRVRIMSDRCNRPEIEGAGARHIEYQLAPNRADKTVDSDLLRDWETTTPMEQFGCLRDRVMCGRALEYALDARAEIRRDPPDLVVSSDLLFGPMVAAEAAGLPYAILAPNLCIHPLPGVPPFGPGFWPARNEEERRRDAQVAALNHAALNQGLPEVNAARRALGLAPLGELAEQIAKAERYWLATSPAFDFPAERLPPLFRYVGPELDDPAEAGPWVPPWASDDSRPLVLVAFSTAFQNQGAAVQRVLDALAELPVRGLLTLGPALDEAFRVPANVAAVRAAPHARVMQEAAAAVSHCGHGTVMKALAAGVPLLCLPMGRDQHDNAARVVARGAGLELPVAAEPPDIAAALRRLLSEPGFRAAAARLGRRVAEDAARSTLVAELECLASRFRRP
jgi:MGT family glycosyltransferase